jgi:hypothetical protein
MNLWMTHNNQTREHVNTSQKEAEVAINNLRKKKKGTEFCMDKEH